MGCACGLWWLERETAEEGKQGVVKKHEWAMPHK